MKISQFVADGVFFAELNEVLTRELAEDGYSGVEVRVTPMRTEIIIRATRTQNVLGIYSLIFPSSCVLYIHASSPLVYILGSLVSNFLFFTKQLDLLFFE